MCSEPEDYFDSKPLKYSEVYEQSSDHNTTVYCCGLANPTEQQIRSAFHGYGEIKSVSCHDTFAFVTFLKKESACTAITNLNGQMIGGNKGRPYINLNMLFLKF